MVAPTAKPSYHSSLITPHFQIPYGEAILSLLTHHSSLSKPPTAKPSYHLSPITSHYSLPSPVGGGK